MLICSKPALHKLNFSDPLPKVIPSLDGLRCVSIVIVLAAHLRNTVGVHTNWNRFFYFLSFGELGGALGVQFFFMISGFLITYLLIREFAQTSTIDFKKFYIRRALRIFPVYYLYLSVILVLTLLGYYTISYPQVLAASLYLNNFYTGGASHWLVGHSWSLCVEEQFYLLWPLLFFLIFKKGKNALKVIFLFILISPILKYTYVSNFDQDEVRIMMKAFLTPFFMHADHLLYGCLLAILFSLGKMNFIRDKRIFNDLFVGITICALVAIGLSPMIANFPFVGSLTSLMFIFILLVSFNEHSATYRVLNDKRISYIGKVSYGIYIYQQFFLTPSTESYSNVWWRSFPFNIILVFMVSIISYQFYEKPILLYKKKFK